jgi:uncharacterized caspase-like protein
MTSRRLSSTFRLACLAAAVTLWIGIAPAVAERRVALVIGNSDYLDVPTLENPRNDAEDVAAALKRLGFDTTMSLDADRAAMQAAIDDFSAKVEGADVALFYYAGHAMQHQGVNYLMPIDANLTNAAGLRRMTKLNDIVSDVKRAKALRIMVIDACRDNPLTEKLEGTQVAAAGGASRSLGLAKISSRTMARAKSGAPEPVTRGGDIIVYAAEAGRTAADGTGRNSPFSGAFVKYVETEGQEVVSLMRRVTTSVQEETKGEQRPELSISVPFEFYFKPGPPAPPPTVAQLVRNARPHEVSAIEAQVEAIMRAIPEKDKEQSRREVMVVLSDVASRSGLRPDMIAQELPQAYARLTTTRRSIEEARFLMENEPEIAPFIEIAAAAVASGRRPDTRAADQALEQAHARYGEAMKAREQANERARANRATLSEQRGNLAQMEYRSKDAAEHYLAAARDTPASDVEGAIRRYQAAANAYYWHGYTFFANDTLAQSIKVNQEHTLRLLDTIVPKDDDEKALLGARKGNVLADIGDSQTTLGGRTGGLEGAKMMVEARATYRKALDSFDLNIYTRLAMDIMDRRASRDLEFGRRMVGERGKPHFDQAVSARRTIWNIQSKHDDYRDQYFRTRNNLAYALQESSRRYDGEAGAKQIAEAIELLEGTFNLFDATTIDAHKNIVRANLAQALGFRAARKPGLEGQADIDRALSLYAEVYQTLNKANDPRLWVIIKQFEAELMRMIGERTTDRDAAFKSLKASFDIYQDVLSVVSRESAPNDWAIVSAEMGYTFVSALPLVSDQARKRFAGSAISLFDAAKPYFAGGGFGNDLQRMDQARKTASAAAGLPDAAPPAGKN